MRTCVGYYTEILLFHTPVFIQFSSVTQLCPTLCNPMNYNTPDLLVHHQLLESTQTHVHWVRDAIQPSHPLSSPLLLPSIFPSIGVFSNESVLHIRWLKYWSFSFSFNPSNEYSGLISFRIDWFDILAVQGTLKSLLQHHSSKASIFGYDCFKFSKEMLWIQWPLWVHSWKLSLHALGYWIQILENKIFYIKALQIIETEFFMHQCFSGKNIMQ